MMKRFGIESGLHDPKPNVPPSESLLLPEVSCTP